MDESIIERLIIVICHWIKVKYYLLLYTYRGRKNMSFVDHAIALAYECEYEGQKQRNSLGQGEVILDTGVNGIVSIHSNQKVTFNITALDAVVANKRYYQVLNELCKTFNQNDESLGYSVSDKNENDCVISITSEIEADPSEKDARYYINGYIERIFAEKKQLLIRAFNKYKQEHPECEYDNVNYNI